MYKNRFSQPWGYVSLNQMWHHSHMAFNGIKSPPGLANASFIILNANNTFLAVTDWHIYNTLSQLKIHAQTATKCPVWWCTPTATVAITVTLNHTNNTYSIFTHNIFITETRKSNSTWDIEYCMPQPVQWRFQHMLFHRNLELWPSDPKI